MSHARFTPRLLSLALLAALPAAQATELPGIDVNAPSEPPAEVSELTHEQVLDRASGDAGELLRSVNGVAASRMGGHGIDPIIRGQRADQINVRLDGMAIHGGCPNRMDPPTSFAVPELYDLVTVVKGVNSVLEGPGGSGGTVLFERDTERLARTPGMHGRGGITTSSNGMKFGTYADGILSSERVYVRPYVSYRDVDNYKDGEGREVPSSLKSQTGGLVAGFRPGAGQVLEVAAEASRTDDALYAGAGMDAPYDKQWAGRLNYRHHALQGPIKRLDASLYQNRVEHLMDNYSLRTPPANRMMWMTAPSSSTTSGARLQLGSDIGAWRVDYGVDFQRNERSATLRGATTGKLAAYLWPDARIDDTGLFAQGDWKMSTDRKLRVALRYDRVRASVNEALPATLATVAPAHSENNLGGLLRLEQNIGDNLSLFGGVSRTVRTADATERFVKQTSAKWFGNPDLSPEKHHQIDAGLTHRPLKTLRWDAVVYYDRVSDFILRDQTKIGTTYRNVDANLYGVEASFDWQIVSPINLAGALNWTRARNTTDSRDIAQIPPLNGRLNLEYAPAQWAAGTRLRFAAKQTHIDTQSGLDTIETPSYAVLDLYGRYAINRNLTVRVGVDNLFDKLYAEHVNRNYSSLFGQPSDRIYEPGRTVWARLDGQF